MLSEEWHLLAFKYFIQIPYLPPKVKVKLPLNCPLPRHTVFVVVAEIVHIFLIVIAFIYMVYEACQAISPGTDDFDRGTPICKINVKTKGTNQHTIFKRKKSKALTFEIRFSQNFWRRFQSLVFASCWFIP